MEDFYNEKYLKDHLEILKDAIGYLKKWSVNNKGQHSDIWESMETDIAMIQVEEGIV